MGNSCQLCILLKNRSPNWLVPRPATSSRVQPSGWQPTNGVGARNPPHPIASSLTAACRRTPPAQFRPGESTRTNRRDHRIAEEGRCCMLNSAIVGADKSRCGCSRCHCRPGCSRCRVSKRPKEEDGVGRTPQNTRSRQQCGNFQGCDTRATRQWLVSTIPSSTGHTEPQTTSSEANISRGS